MAISVLPQRKNAVDYAEPYIQAAFQMMLKKRFEDEQMKQNLSQAQTMFPSAFSPALNAAGQNYSNQNPAMVEAPVGMQGMANQGGQIPVKPEMSTIPDKYKSMVFNPEAAQQYPGLGINFKSGEMEYKVPSTLGTMPIININQEGQPEQIGTAPRGAKVVSSVAQEKFNLEKEEKAQQLKEKSDFIINQAQDTLDTIAEVKNGISNFGAFGQYMPKEIMPGTPYYTWRTNVDKLLSKKMIDLMTEMKSASKTGATGFGQLSEREGQILRDASTALKRGLPPEKAQEYLNTMETMLKKVIESKGGQGNNQPTDFDFSNTSTEELLKRKQQLLGGGR